MHKGKREVFKCAPTTVTMLCKLSSIVSWHSPLVAQGQLTVMQDLAGHKLSASARVSAALPAQSHWAPEFTPWLHNQSCANTASIRNGTVN